MYKFKEKKAKHVIAIMGSLNIFCNRQITDYIKGT